MSAVAKFVSAARHLQKGSELLQRHCSTKRPSLVTGEGFRWDVKSSPHKLMAQVTDYVDANGYFMHEELPWNMHFTADFEKSVRMNQNRESKDVSTYWPESCLFRIDHEQITYLEGEFAKWDVRSGMNANVQDWAIGGARTYSMFPEVPWDRIAFGYKRFIEVFIVDDPFEQSCRTGTASSFGSAYLSNCEKIVMNQHGLINLQDFESDRVTRKLIDDALFGQECLLSTTELARKTLTPQLLRHFQGGSLIFFEYLMRESVNFYKHVQEKAFIDYDSLLETRVITIGLEYVLSAVLPQDGSIHDRLMGHFNPFLHALGACVSIDNDIAASPKETGLSDGSEICPINFFFSVSKQHSNPMDSVRATLLLRNAMILQLEQQIKMLPKTWRKSYENLFKLAFAFTDYEYVLGHGRPNPRYGNTWKEY